MKNNKRKKQADKKAKIRSRWERKRIKNLYQVWDRVSLTYGRKGRLLPGGKCTVVTGLISTW